MSIYQRYLIREWVVAFIFSLLSFFLILFSSEVFENLHVMLEHHVSLAVAVRYHGYQMPYLVIKLLPISSLMATMYTVSKLAKTHELLALRVAGVGNMQLAWPFLLSAFIVSLSNLGLDETIVPYGNMRARIIKQEQIHKAHVSSGIAKPHMTFVTSSGTFIYARWFDSDRGAMDSMTALEMDARGRIITRMDAVRASFEHGRWMLHDVVTRTFDHDTNQEHLARHSTYQPAFLDPPAEFAKPFRRLEELTIVQAWQHIQTLKRRGERFTEEAVHLYLKTAFPFASLILALLGIPFALLTGQRLGVIFGFSLSVLVGFLYWGCLAISVSLGKNAVLSPLTAAWMGNIIFGGIGCVLLLASRRA